MHVLVVGPQTPLRPQPGVLSCLHLRNESLAIPQTLFHDCLHYFGVRKDAAECYRPFAGRTTTMSDPASAAVGLAASIIQLVTFAGKVISIAKEIHSSASGSPEQVVDLETNYGHLQNLTTRLGASTGRASTSNHGPGHLPAPQCFAGLRELSQLCKKDCDELLKTVGKIKGGSGGKSGWKSVKIALRTVWESSGISELEQKLHYHQGTLTLHLCALAR